MSNTDVSLPVFAEDELQIMVVPTSWSMEDLLAQSGIFFLKDITDRLRIDSTQIKKIARAIRLSGGSPWDQLGARKVWNHWLIRMSVFAPYYRANLYSPVRDIDPDWDGNRVLQEEGIFYLTDVCRLIPFSPHQIRYQVKRSENAREKFGVWKDENNGIYLVDMALFSVWIRSIWLPD